MHMALHMRGTAGLESMASHAHGTACGCDGRWTTLYLLVVFVKHDKQDQQGRRPSCRPVPICCRGRLRVGSCWHTDHFLFLLFSSITTKSASMTGPDCSYDRPAYIHTHTHTRTQTHSQQRADDRSDTHTHTHTLGGKCRLPGCQTNTRCSTRTQYTRDIHGKAGWRAHFASARPGCGLPACLHHPSTHLCFQRPLRTPCCGTCQRMGSVVWPAPPPRPVRAPLPAAVRC